MENRLTIFYLENCPYCRKAIRAAKELETELPGFSADSISWIEERECADIADRYDYYRVPSIFLGDEKLYECSPSDDYDEIKRNLKAAVETAIAG